MLWLILLALGCGNSELAPIVAPAPAPLPQSSDADAFTLWVPAKHDARWSNARCNDGTAAGLGLSTGDDANTWVIQVLGGFFCDDKHTDCSGRERRLTTAPVAKGKPIVDGDTYPAIAQGLLSRDADQNPLFHDANLVQAQYCTSDFWLGETIERRPTTGSDDGWYFSGRPVLRADLELLATQGLDQANPATEILVIGTSAGGLGVAHNLPLFQDVWPDAIKSGRVKVLIDGAWIADRELGPTPKANAWGPLLPACEARLMAEGKDPLSCVFGRSWYPEWKAAGVPVLVQQSGLDLTQLAAYKIKGFEASHAWREQAKTSMRDVDWLFSGGFRYHVIATTPKIGAGPHGATFNDLMASFWGNEAPRRVVFRYED